MDGNQTPSNWPRPFCLFYQELTLKKSPRPNSLFPSPFKQVELPRIPGKGLGPTCFSWTSELTLTLQISQWKVRSWAGASGSPGVGGPSLG